MNFDFNSITTTAVSMLTYAGMKILGAAVLWFVGRWLIWIASRLLDRTLRHQSFDQTLTNYVCSSVSVLLNIALVVALLGFFGVETTTFAALLAGVGLAIGAAWSGLLSNFASGVFLVVLRPFRVGDFVTAGGITGTVRAVGLFGTTIVTPDNVQTIVGNSKILGDTIQNFSTNPYRRVDLTAQLAHDVDHKAAIALFKKKVAAIPNVLKDPAPDVEILQFTMAGPVLAVRPYCSNDHYWQVYFDTNRAIREGCQEAGYPIPEQHIYSRGAAQAAVAGS